MLGFHPLAASPLASTSAILIAVSGPMSATGGLAFGGSPSAFPRTRISATGGISFGGDPHLSAAFYQSISASGGLTFSGSGFLTTEVYRSATGGLTFNGAPLLKVAGRPLVFTALSESFDFRADGADYSHTALTVSFDFRGVPE